MIIKLLKKIDPLGFNHPMPQHQPKVEETKLTTCPDCERLVSRQAASCPHCGRKLKEEQTAIGLLAAIIIGLLIAYFLFAH